MLPIADEDNMVFLSGHSDFEGMPVVGTETTILTVHVPPIVEEVLTEHFGDRCEFLRATNAIEAFQHLVTGRVDAAVINYELPSVSAADVVRSLRSIPNTQKVPVAVVTKNCDEATFRQCNEAGSSVIVDQAMPKEFLAEWLSKLVEDCQEAAEPPSQDHGMATSIASATKEVMSTLLGMTLTAGTLVVEKTKPHKADVIASISFSGFMTGSITLFMSMEFAATIVAKMLAEEDKDPTDEQIVDAVGELTNLIAGNIKNYLSRKKALFAMSSPSVIVGQQVRRVSLQKHICFLTPFYWHDQKFLVEFLMVSRAL